MTKNLTGESVSYGGCLGTGVVKLTESLNAGRTGLTEQQAKEAGYDVITATCVTDDKHDNIQPLIDFLAEHGLSTGGTGSLVRPVVSCKGTTCQYGLADTYGLSEKIHEKFYIGYHGVTLPHKFKICVGGCPNNCAKPSLNDLGIVGQKTPMIDYSKCRGCKKCQIVESCPHQDRGSR